MAIDYLFRAFPVHVNHHYYVFQNSKGEPKRICKLANAKRDKLNKISFVDLIAKLTSDFNNKKSTMSLRELGWLKDIIADMKTRKSKKIESSKYKNLRRFFSEIQNKLKGYGRQTSDKMAEKLLNEIHKQVKITPKPELIKLTPLPEVPKEKHVDELKHFIKEMTQADGTMPGHIRILKDILTNNSTDFSKLNDKCEGFNGIIDLIACDLSTKKCKDYSSNLIESWKKWITILVQEYKAQPLDSGRGTPLHRALCYGYLPTSLIETFIQLGVDPKKKSDKDVLYKATAHHCQLEPKAIEILAQYGCDVNASYGRNDQTLIHSMHWNRIPTNIIAALLKCGANPNSSLKDGILEFGFINKGEKNDPELLKILIDYRADIYAGFHSPLLMAAWRGETECIEKLLDLGVDPIESNEDQSVMHFVATHQVSPDKLKPLITSETIKAKYLGENFLSGYKSHNNVSAIKQVHQILKSKKS